MDPSLSGFTEADRQMLFQVSSAHTATQQAALYPQSVASGDPRPHGIVLWTRVEPSLQDAPSGDMVAWQISSSSSFDASSVLIEGVAMLSADRDSTVKLSVSNSALQPFHTYYYRFLYNQVASRTGRFKTLPLATSSLPELRLGYVVCQDFGKATTMRFDTWTGSTSTT